MNAVNEATFNCKQEITLFSFVFNGRAALSILTLAVLTNHSLDMVNWRTSNTSLLFLPEPVPQPRSKDFTLFRTFWTEKNVIQVIECIWSVSTIPYKDPTHVIPDNTLRKKKRKKRKKERKQASKQARMKASKQVSKKERKKERTNG